MQGSFQQYNPQQQQLLQQIQEQSRKSRRQTAYVIGGIVIFLLVVYLFFASVFPKMAIKFIAVHSEIEMGDQLYRGLQQEIKIDKNASTILQNFADQLHLSKQYPIRVSVAVSEEVNAYALPGGHIVVNSAILRELKTPESLVALLCHESTHINRRHSLQNILSSVGTGFVLRLISNAGGDAANVIIGNADYLMQMNYSRKLEKQADEEGMVLMLRNEINPDGMMQLMQRLKETNEADSPQGLSFLSSHPLTEERIKDAARFKKSHPFTQKQMNEGLLDYWNQLEFVVKDIEASSDESEN